MKPDLSDADRAELTVLAKDEGHWAQLNQRRIHLIEKQFTQGLSTAEEAELAQLQARVDEYIDAIHPLPTQALRELQESVCQAACGTEKKGKAETRSP